jgi:hypothetical protein
VAHDWENEDRPPAQYYQPFPSDLPGRPHERSERQEVREHHHARLVDDEDLGLEPAGDVAEGASLAQLLRHLEERARRAAEHEYAFAPPAADEGGARPRWEVPDRTDVWRRVTAVAS